MTDLNSEHHVVAYVQRKRISDWKRGVLYGRNPLFVYGSSDEYVFARKLRRNSTLWVVSSLPDERPPELVAKLVITSSGKLDAFANRLDWRVLCRFREFKWLALASGRLSRFFGNNDASRALLQTFFRRASGSPMLGEGKKRWSSQYGIKLLRPAEIIPEGEIIGGKKSPGAEPLKKLEKLAAEKSVFISYKWCDNDRDFVRRFAYALVKEGFVPWLDILALPQALALEKIQQDAPLLEKLLRYGYKHCRAIIALGTKRYGESSHGSAKNWTWRELSGQVAPGVKLFKVLYPRKGKISTRVSDSTDAILTSKNPERAAKEFTTLFAARATKNRK